MSRSNAQPNAQHAAAPGESWTIGRLLQWTQSHFEKAGLDAPRLSAELLLAHAMDCRRIDLYARFEQEPSDSQRAAFRALVRRAAEHQPIAYLTGSKEFYSLDFFVTPDVLIPRPETELLVERTIDYCRDHPADRHDVLDVGTGSGCIAIAISKRVATVRAVATDVSEAALAVARRNVERHGLTDRVRLVQADLLELPNDALPPADGTHVPGFDVIVSNPPYIGHGERDALPKNVRDYEPAVALFAGPDALAVYRRIAADAERHLKPAGTLLLEVGMGHAAAVEEIFEGATSLNRMGRFKDLAGIERVVQFERAR